MPRKFSVNNTVHLSKTKNRRPHNSKVLSLLQPVLPIKHKRCPNGTRFDKKQHICLKNTVIKQFDNLEYIQISKEKPTITIEILDEVNKECVIKNYQNGVLISQNLIDKSNFQKQKQISEIYLKKIFDFSEKLSKDPTILEKNIKFKNFKKKLAKSRSGGGETQEKIDEDPNKKSFEILVQNGVIEYFSDDKMTVEFLKERTNSLKKEAIEANIESTNKEIESFYMWNTISTKVVRLIEGVAKIGIYGFLWCMFSSFIGIWTVSFFIYDIIGLLCLVIYDIITFFFPSKESFDNLVLIEYVYYTIYIIFGSIVGVNTLSTTTVTSLTSMINYYISIFLLGGIVYEGMEGVFSTTRKANMLTGQYEDLLKKKEFFEKKLDEIPKP
jgi:hypothetical protein